MKEWKPIVNGEMPACSMFYIRILNTQTNEEIERIALNITEAGHVLVFDFEDTKAVKPKGRGRFICADSPFEKVTHWREFNE